MNDGRRVKAVTRNERRDDAGVVLGPPERIRRKEPAMQDVVFVLVTVASFVLIALVLRGVERL